jgi:hypothetical protein
MKNICEDKTAADFAAGKTIEELLSIDAAADSELGPYCYNEEEEGRIQFLEDSFHEEPGPIEQE